jgi:hypothetical protein
VALASFSDIFYFQDVDYANQDVDYANGVKEFSLNAKIGRGGIADFVDPSGALHLAHEIFSGLPIGTIAALTVIEFAHNKPIHRTPYFVVVRKGIRYPDDFWFPETRKPIINTRAKDISNSRFAFQSRQSNGNSTDVFAADFDGARMRDLSKKSQTASDGLRDRLGKIVGRWVRKDTVEFDSMRRGRHQLVRKKDVKKKTSGGR